MRSDAQKKADKKYHAKTFKAFTVNAKTLDYELIDNYCKFKGISKASFVVNCCKSAIENDIEYVPDIPLDKQSN